LQRLRHWRRFSLLPRSGAGKHDQERGGCATPSQAASVTAALALLCIANASTLRGLQPLFVKGAVEEVTQYEFIKWNTYSRIAAFFPRVGYPYMWGRSPLAPKDLRIEQRYINIDGEAATSMRST
jgi:hypothetical protein